MACYSNDAGTIHISTGPPMEEAARHDLGERWCFRCRKRTTFFDVVMAPTDLSYYGPHIEVRCGSCDAIDGDLFPGYEREVRGL